jgi:hypothetical protein
MQNNTIKKHLKKISYGKKEVRYDKRSASSLRL